MQTRQTGLLGESLAARYLRQRGYDILASNWRCPRGELDIIARLGNKLVFLEVRTRRQSDTEAAFASITARKRKRLLAAIHEWLEANRQQEADWQVDVIGVALGDRTEIDHVEDALDW
ncbi:MAG: YraN family protein [Anaerolineae bacterium]|nr:YraN family protein [Anaerolineae bacterium]